MTWDPEEYGEVVAEIPGYEELQEAVAARVLARNPGARWTGIDGSEAMVAHARRRLPGADLRVQRLEDTLPKGPFDLVVSVLAVHHLDREGKRDLFKRIAQVSDTFVLGDVVVPEHPEDAVIEIDWVEDLPCSVPEQLAWLEEAGFEATAEYVRPDLAVFVARA
jgi:tRNA (cmo5U34)-methyltransferase